MPYLNARHRLIGMLEQFGAAVLYALLVHIEHLYFESDAVIGSFEPASGLALAALLIFGKRYAWCILLGAIFANAMQHPFMDATIISSGDTLQAFCGAWLLTRNAGFDRAIHSLNDYLRLISLGGCVSVGVGALIAITTLLVFGFVTPKIYPWELLHWWMGDMLGIILVAPLILVCWETKNDWRGAKRITEAALLLGLTFLAGQIIFLGWLHDSIGQMAKGYVMFLFITWVAVRLGARGTVIAINMVAVQGLLGAHHGIGYFANDIAQTQLVNYWLYTLILSGVGMALTTFISGHKRMDEVLRRSEMKFRTLYDSTSDAVMLLDEKGFLDCNKATLEMIGCATKEEFCTKHPADFSPPQQPDGTNSLLLANQHIVMAMEQGNLRFEWTCKRLDTGRIFIADVLLSAMELEGKLVLQVVIRDITGRKRVEVALRESEERLRNIIDNAFAAIFLKDTAGRYLLVNARYEKLFHLSNADIRGKTDYDIFPKNVADAFVEADKKAIRTGQLEVEELVPQDDGIHTYISVKFPLRNASGETYAVCGIALDITERKAAERQLRELSAHLLSVREEEKIRIAREIHDELGGTLTALKIDTYWLSRRLPVNDETAALAGRIESMAQRIDNAVSATRRIIDDMRPTILDDLGLLPALEWQAAEFYKRSGIECSVNCIENEANLDNQRSIALFRILQESLTNVSRHSGASKVEIQFHHSEKEVTLTVSDNGCGILESYMTPQKLYGLSYGLLGMTERTGQLGGKVIFSNPPGGGFCVEVILPLPAGERNA